ncbi:hypothetical protein [Neomegalonema sp.]|uniref:hypothetical protein n=1 Tax=Neomegalonema sp. TaxID=2039713 RepID=UPI00261FEEA8|nr:hypothetical protein [Neomegalonema sp.]MDD2870329.1 hypothetical protein [Neomegalonema sp.]
MKQVKFVKKHPPYNEGELAGFSPEAATDLEKQSFVKILGDVKPKKKPEPPAPAAPPAS